MPERLLHEMLSFASPLNGALPPRLVPPMKTARISQLLSFSFTLLAIASAAAPAFAASPAFSALAPRGGQRGTEVEVTLTGARLEDAKEILFYEKGIEAGELQLVNATTVKVKFKIAPDAELGSHRMRLRTATGLTELRPFFVGALPEVEEKEPNSDFSSPQAISLNVTVNGNIGSEDVDYFAIDAKKGDRINVEVEAIRLGTTLFDVYVAIMNPARFELNSSDDNPLVWQDGVASLVAPEDGKYIIMVRDSAFTGAGTYRLHVGNFPRPLGVYPAGGRAGESLPVLFVGDVAGNREETVTLPSQLADAFGLFAKDERGIAPSKNWFRITDLGNVLEAEPNETHDNATRFTAPVALNGILATAGDVDHFRFTAKKGEVYDVRVHARSLRSPVDPVLTVFAAGKGAVGANDDTGGPDSYLRLSIPNDGDYVISVRDHLGNGGANYIYRVELTPVKPVLNLTTSEFVQYVQPTVSVPRGGRTAVVLSASRRDFGGPLQIRGENLPAGITIESPGAAANSSVIPVIFQAAADAGISGKLSDVIGFVNDPAQPNLKVEGKVEQPMVLVRGQNQIPFWIEQTNTLPVAVIEECPFDISIVEPKVPLVRGGQMELKVIAQRKEGFTAPIKVDMLWLPPGIGASGSISIAEGQTEALIPLNAAGNAELNTWKIAVRGQATVGNGPIMVCTPFANLRVAEMYMNFAFEATAVEQGKEAELVVHVEKKTDFEGNAKVEVFGLPNKVAAAPLEVNKESKDLVFKLTTDATSPAGNHNNVFCRVTVMENGEPVVHNLGTGKLRIDTPLPPKKTDAAPAQAAQKPADAPAKRLSRLEQLRLDQQEREKAKKAAEAQPAAAAPGGK